MTKIFGLANRKFSRGCPLDDMEEIIIDRVKMEDSFDCSKKHISETVLAVHNVKDNEFMSLLVGPYPKYRKTSLETFSRKVSTILYETGLKEEIISIVFAIILKEMKNRFGSNKKYVYVGVDGIREEGVIKLK
jgi:hypothetical protein